MQSIAGEASDYVHTLGFSFDCVGPPLLGRAVLAAAAHMKKATPRDPIDPNKFRLDLQTAREYVRASNIIPLVDGKAFSELGEFDSLSSFFWCG